LEITALPSRLGHRLVFAPLREPSLHRPICAHSCPFESFVVLREVGTSGRPVPLSIQINRDRGPQVGGLVHLLFEVDGVGRVVRIESPSELIDARIEDLGDWRGEMLSRLRALIKEADPEVAEEWKWRGTPVWSHNGLICTGETYKNVVKMTFAKGASLKDPSGLFNSSLEGNARRAIDFHEGDKLDEEALKALIRAAVALNKSSARG
jgi:hypothetical protein